MIPAQLLHPHGELTANDVMVDYLDYNLRRLKRTLTNLTDDCLYWQADEQANSIAINLWHMGRILDVFFIQLTLGLPSDQECWIAGGWSKKTGYDPRGLGRDGWGSVNEYTLEEVAAMPKFSLELLQEFIENVCGTLREYLLAVQMETLSEAAPGFDGQFTRYQIISMALMDNVRHLGEIRLIKSLWARIN
ncbi:DinB family protein [Chloroflexota bacterium]